MGFSGVASFIYTKSLNWELVLNIKKEFFSSEHRFMTIYYVDRCNYGTVAAGCDGGLDGTRGLETRLESPSALLLLISSPVWPMLCVGVVACKSVCWVVVYCRVVTSEIYLNNVNISTVDKKKKKELQLPGAWDDTCLEPLSLVCLRCCPLVTACGGTELVFSLVVLCEIYLNISTIEEEKTYLSSASGMPLLPFRHCVWYHALPICLFDV